MCSHSCLYISLGGASINCSVCVGGLGLRGFADIRWVAMLQRLRHGLHPVNNTIHHEYVSAPSVNSGGVFSC